MTRLMLPFTLFASLSFTAVAEWPSEPADAQVAYAERDTRTLYLHMYYPKGWQPTDQRPAAVFFFGGGFTSGTPRQFSRHARLLARHGMVAATADYRTKSRDQVDPTACVQDAKAAFRYLHREAHVLGIDPERIASGGGSAGGHLAAAIAFVHAWDEPGAEGPMPCPAALLLYNPVLDNGPKGYGHRRVKAYWEAFSPMHRIAAPAPPAIFLVGDRDALVPVATAREFERRMQAAGAHPLEIHVAEQAGHGYFNHEPHYTDTTRKMVEFLRTLGWVR